LPFAVLVVVWTSNAVNLTDGLDGLAIGPVIINAGTYLVWAYLAGATFGIANVAQRFVVARYLDIPPIASIGELGVYCGTMVGAGIGFLWYNTYPAQVFMGDVGSLALGGGLGMCAVFTKNELLSVILGRRLLPRGGQRHRPGRVLQAHGEARVSHGSDPPPLRKEGVARAEDHRPLLDRLHFVGPRGHVELEAAMRLARASFRVMELSGKRVVVVGLGASGVAAARLCARRGARVTATDAKTRRLGARRSRSLDEGVTLVWAATRAQVSTEADLIVVSPGVPSLPELERAEREGCRWGEVELAVRALRTRRLSSPSAGRTARARRPRWWARSSRRHGLATFTGATSASRSRPRGRTIRRHRPRGVELSDGARRDSRPRYPSC
jgi:hypothetical protein